MHSSSCPNNEVARQAIVEELPIQSATHTQHDVMGRQRTEFLAQIYFEGGEHAKEKGENKEDAEARQEEKTRRSRQRGGTC